jgi:hypothetical protein
MNNRIAVGCVVGIVGVLAASILTGCGASTPPGDMPADLLAEATAEGAKFLLWAPDRAWTGWAISIADNVSCPGAALGSGQHVTACTEPAEHTVQVSSSLNVQDIVQALTHELEHVTLVEANADSSHCNWSKKLTLLAAIADVGGTGANFEDTCNNNVECTFNNGKATCQ